MLQMGFRVALSDRFFIQQTFLINQNLKTIQKENGVRSIVDVAFANYPSGSVTTYYNADNTAIHTTERFHGGAAVSVRICVGYHLRFMEKSCSVNLFRNFSLSSIKMPWWGLGFSVML